MGQALVAEAQRLRHLMRELAKAGLDLRADPAPAFAIVKVAEADRVLLGVLLRAGLELDEGVYDRLAPQLVGISMDKRRRLLDALPPEVRTRLLSGLETAPPTSDEIWALAMDLHWTGADERFGGRGLPLKDTQVQAFADALSARASSPATWDDLWLWP